MGRFLICLLLFALTATAEELPVAGLAHAGFRVSDMEKARRFYTGVLGYQEVFNIKRDDGSVLLSYFKINEDQYIEVFPNLPPDEDVRLTHVALQTPDIGKLHRMLEERGVPPGKIQRGRDGNMNFSIKDPDGNRLEMVQYLPDSSHEKARGRFLGEDRISTRLTHAGLKIANLEAAMVFYRDKLGFRETWRGGPTDNEVRWVNMRMPGSRGDYVEFMLYSQPPTRQALGSMQHICLEVPDIQAAYKKLLERGLPAEDRYKPRVGRNKRWLLNLFDPDGSRTELMEPKDVP
jgi:lactoylglutathione lyase